MRWSQYFLFTSREVPADAEVVSHQLMVRAGMLRKHAAGIYSYLPFGWRSMMKMMDIVRRELDAVGCQELEMPAIQPAELWQESERWRQYGKELLRMKDRHERDFCFGPTHEEVVTDLVRRNVKSYRQLPLNLYQIQTKFRDEVRPRFGLMRGREFLMKDAYSFHADDASLDTTYRDMHGAYSRIIESCDLDYIVVEADSGAIGGTSSHEFMVLAETGESAVVRSRASGYAANVEKAQTRLPAPPAPLQNELEEVATPALTTVEEVADHLGIEPPQIVKTLLYQSDRGTVAVAIRGDRQINEIKLSNLLAAEWIELAKPEEVERLTGAPVGFAGPVGLENVERLIADQSTREMENFACGANKADAHLVGVNWGRDAEPSEFADVLLVAEGDPDVESGEPLEMHRGIEVGHIFKLGTKYSESMGCTFAAEEGPDQPMIMGCYGLGIGRTVAAAIEQNHDDDGIVWPLPLAPFQVLLIALSPDDERVGGVAERLYSTLSEAGWEVLYDDRDMGPGAKFKDADLVGIPLRVVVGSRSLENGGVELSLRRAPRERSIVPEEEVPERLTAAAEELA